MIQDKNLLKIALFALIAHFIFDMITVSGVPLLYPFYKNPCVIPANPAFRFKSGDRRSELVVTGLCGLLCATMQPLFSQGFWTSYNRTFGTVQHVDRENRNTAFYVICDYSYIQNARTLSGNAIVIESTEKELTLFDRRHVFKLSSDNPQMKINYAKPRVSDIEKRFEELQFFNIGYDSLQVLLSGKLASGLIQSNQNVRYMEDAVSYFTNFIKFANRFDFHVYANIDSARSPVRANIARLESSIEETRRRHRDQLSRYNARVAGIQKIEDTLRSSTLSHYERNKFQKQLIALRNQNIDPPVYTPPASLRSELAALKKSLSENNLLFSGHLTIFTFGYSVADRHATPTPDYDCQRLLASSSTPDPPD
jgi:inner membrane protein